MDLTTRFTTYLREERLWRPGQRWLLAVSGGLDSVVLTHLCVQAGIEGALAHCNFQLRDEESDRDEAFVRALADRYGRPVYVHHFDTQAYASTRKVSIQVAARELRYSWFRTLIAGAGAVDAPSTSAAIATAHHLDDNIETLLMNLVKGTGAAGLRGMLPLQDQVVRPLLFATREDLEVYAAAQGLDHVEDSSNATDRYNRNFFRHRIIPLLEERYPNVRDNLADNLSRFKELEILVRQSVNRHREDLLEPGGKGAWKIAVAKLERAEPLRTILFELLKPFGFNAAQAGEAMALLHSSPGHFVASATHRVIRDRRFLLICSPETEGVSPVVIEKGDTSASFPQGVVSLTAGDPSQPGIDPRTALRNADPAIALLDAAHINFPLLLRRWKPGDYFYPLGMRKKKKLARFFIDGKLSLADKEKVWVLESSGKILWVVGLRIDERYKVGPATSRVLRLEWTPRTDP